MTRKASGGAATAAESGVEHSFPPGTSLVMRWAETPLGLEDIRVVCCVCRAVLREVKEPKATSHGVCPEGDCVDRWKRGDFGGRAA